MNITGSQGNRQLEWVYPEHPLTAIGATPEVYANHNEGVAKRTTPAMVMGFCDRPVSIHELLTSRGFDAILH